MKTIIYFLLVFLGIISASCSSPEREYLAMGSSLYLENDRVRMDTSIILSNKYLGIFIIDLEGEEIKEIESLSDGTENVTTFLARLNGSFSIRLKEYKPDSTTEVKDDGLEILRKKMIDRRLIVYGHGKNISYLTYYIGSTVHVVLLRTVEEGVFDLWTGISTEELKSKEQVLKYLNAKRTHGTTEKSILI